MSEPLWIDAVDALTLHGRLLALNGGATGMRDDALLKSALARPQQHFADEPAADIIQLAAIYTAGILRNHPVYRWQQTHRLLDRHSVPGDQRLRVHSERGGCGECRSGIGFR